MAQKEEKKKEAISFETVTEQYKLRRKKWQDIGEGVSHLLSNTAAKGRMYKGTM